jgi:hypothetical protein
MLDHASMCLHSKCNSTSVKLVFAFISSASHMALSCDYGRNPTNSNFDWSRSIHDASPRRRRGEFRFASQFNAAIRQAFGTSFSYGTK